MQCLKFSQKIPLSLEKNWRFFSDPANLKILTPPYLGFEITNGEILKMFPGQIISYIIRPLWNIPIEWVTEITHVEEPYYFVDEQRFGPYKFWHHEHRFEPIAEGTLMSDTIFYILPYGPLGQLMHRKVKKDIEHIFSFRKQKLLDLFGPLP